MGTQLFARSRRPDFVRWIQYVDRRHRFDLDITIDCSWYRRSSCREHTRYRPCRCTRSNFSHHARKGSDGKHPRPWWSRSSPEEQKTPWPHEQVELHRSFDGVIRDWPGRVALEGTASCNAANSNASVSSHQIRTTSGLKIRMNESTFFFSSLWF